MITRRMIFVFGGVVIVVVLMLLAIVAVRQVLAPETVTLAQINRDIAFLSDRDGGQWGIYTINPDGDIIRLTPADDSGATDDCTPRNWGEGHCAFDYFPSYAFDGEMLNFLTNRHLDEIGPAQVRTDGTEFRVLDVLGAITAVAVDQRFDWDPQWSVDGRIGWSKIADLNLEIFIADADGSNERRLTRDGINGPRDWFLGWSPDGAALTYSSDRNGGIENIYRVDLSDEELTPVQLTDNPVDDFRATWALDGESILFISDVDDGLLRGDVQLFLMNPDGSDQRPLGSAVFEGGAAYSPDGSQMVYMSNEGGAWNLYLRDVATGDTVQLTDDAGDDLFPVWQPLPLTSGE